jgi:hypothetical protein
MDRSSKGFSFDGKNKHVPRLTVAPSAGLKRHMRPPLARQRMTNTSGDVPQDRGPLADKPVQIEAADTSGNLADNRPSENAATTAIKFPLCDAAVQKIEGGGWDLADAIVAECFETGDDGVRNASKMEEMREEIAKNRGVDLSFERLRKLRKVASAFPASRSIYEWIEIRAARPPRCHSAPANPPEAQAVAFEPLRDLALTNKARGGS